jgi:hypothetical protein
MIVVVAHPNKRDGSAHTECLRHLQGDRHAWNRCVMFTLRRGNHPRPLPDAKAAPEVPKLPPHHLKTPYQPPAAGQRPAPLETRPAFGVLLRMPR